jgi:hypothetical protein
MKIVIRTGGGALARGIVAASLTLDSVDWTEPPYTVL